MTHGFQLVTGLSWVQHGWLNVAAVALLISSVASAEDSLSGSGARSLDQYCGPYCIQYLLKSHLNLHVDVVDLIKETQWPSLEAGADLQHLQECLNSRGVSTSAQLIDHADDLNWPAPVLVHLKQAVDSAGSSDQHFVVWLPSSTGQRIEIWDGGNGFRTMAPSAFRSLRSGYVLLTSKNAITNPQSSVIRTSPFISFSAVLTAVLVVGCVAHFARSVLQNSSKGQKDAEKLGSACRL